MGPDIRLSGRSGLLVALFRGLTPEQAAALQERREQIESGAGPEPAPLFSRPGGPGELMVTGTASRLRELAQRIETFGVLSPGTGETLRALVHNHERADFRVPCCNRVLDLGSRTHVMGILNVTPDSFSDGGRFAAAESAVIRAQEMVAEGADIIDIGGESTRPGAEPVDEEEQLRRVIPVIERLSGELAVPLSIDTYKASVARKALAAGASIVNDISGLRFSPDMAKVVADSGAAVVVMHIQGEPRNMQQNPVYADVVAEVREYLADSIEIALQAGVDRERLIVDPGIGFGKNLEHNLRLIERLDELRSLGRPILLGTSRKKFIGTVLGIPVPEDRVDGTAATVAIGIERGARILRVHDVGRMVRVARMTDAIVRSNIVQSKKPES